MNKYLVTTFLTFVFLTSATTSFARQMTLALQWTHQAQFAGFYVAQEKGFYKEAGLDLKILPSNADLPSSARLDALVVDYATMFLSTAIDQYNRGVGLVNIAQLVQRSSLLLVTHKNRNINKVEDFSGRRISSWGAEFQVQANGLFNEKGADVTITHSKNPLELFLRGVTDGTLAMWYNEYHTLLNYGLRKDELKIFYFKDTRFDIPEDGIYCLSYTLNKYPEETKALVEGTKRGWQYVFEHPEEALDIVEKKMQEDYIPFTRVHQRWMLEKMKHLFLAEDGEEMGYLSEESFNNTVKVLTEASILDKEIKYEEFHKDLSDVQ